MRGAKAKELRKIVTQDGKFPLDRVEYRKLKKAVKRKEYHV